VTARAAYRSLAPGFAPAIARLARATTIVSVVLVSTATNAAAAGGRWISLGMLGGSTRPDPALADYQWDVRPRGAWGAQALIGGDRFATGLRAWRSGTTQRIGAGIDPVSVRETSVELVGRAHLAERFGIGASLVAGAGRLHLGFDPDRVAIPLEGGGSAGEASLAPIDEWMASAGMALARPIAERWALGLEIDHRRFALDTAHREGDAIESARTSFGEWSVRLELARHHRLH
jgi:hypothetical protein